MACFLHVVEPRGVVGELLFSLYSQIYDVTVNAAPMAQPCQRWWLLSVLF